MSRRENSRKDKSKDIKKLKIGSVPNTRVDNVADIIHQKEITDPYRWLEDQESKETREWIGEQNKYTDSILSQIPNRNYIRDLVAALIKIEVISTPISMAGRYFYSKRRPDDEQDIIYMRNGLEGEERTLIDPHPMSSDHSTSVNICGVSNDGRYLLYCIRQGGVDEVEFKILDVNTGKNLSDVLPVARYGHVEMAPDNSGLYYARFNKEGERVYYHKIGTDVTKDPVIFGEGLTPDKILYVLISDNGRWLLGHVIDGCSGPVDVYIRRLGSDEGWKPVIKDGKSHSYACFAGDKLVILTDMNAPKKRVFVAEPDNPCVEHWKEIIPETQDASLEKIIPAGGKLIVNYLKDVQSRVAVYDIDGTRVRDIKFETIGSIENINGVWENNELFFCFSSFHIPDTIYRYNIATGEKNVWATVKIPINTDEIEAKQIYYSSKDGTKVPMFLIYKKGIKRGGKNPTLIYGYGGFNISLTPHFIISATIFANHGGVFALANIRGGGEFGEDWHQAGILEKKQTVFDDFIAASEWLINEGYTSSKHLGIMGGSNGGLLVGACMTQRPDLYEAVICTYPLLDMVRYHSFMVARFWVSEYGCSEDPAQFEYILKYSPYHNVKKGMDYPATLFITGDGDTRVAPLHARKMAAMLQSNSLGKRPVMLRYHIIAGHAGNEPVSRKIDQIVDTLMFVMWRLGNKINGVSSLPGA